MRRRRTLTGGGTPRATGGTRLDRTGSAFCSTTLAPRSHSTCKASRIVIASARATRFRCSPRRSNFTCYELVQVDPLSVRWASVRRYRGTGLAGCWPPGNPDQWITASRALRGGTVPSAGGRILLSEIAWRRLGKSVSTSHIGGTIPPLHSCDMQVRLAAPTETPLAMSAKSVVDFALLLAV